MSARTRLIDKEVGVHGSSWNARYGGYFGDPQIAQPLIEVIAREIQSHRPDVVADLGGGTGVVLRQLIEHMPSLTSRLVNVELSEPQQAQCDPRRIEVLARSITEVSRQDLAVGDGCLMFIMRSVLHYLGKRDVMGFLRRIRSQMASRESFVHQSACFETPQEAGCYNRLYERMGIDKAYFTVDELGDVVRQGGFEVVEILPAPTLPLRSSELVERYSVSVETMADITRELVATYGVLPEVLEPQGDGFIGCLHYRTYVCHAG